MEIIIFITALFFSMSVLTESLGIWARVLGACNNEPTTGYSTHVRIASLGRFFILVSAPTLGYLVDSGINGDQILIIGTISFFIVLVSIILFLNIGFKYFGKIYNVLNKNSYVDNVPVVPIRDFKIYKKFIIMALFSYILTGTGVIWVNYFATKFPIMRAMIVQLSAVFTMFGTLIHVFFIDPKLSEAADNNKEQLIQLSILFLFSRAISCILLILIFVGIMVIR